MEAFRLGEAVLRSSQPLLPFLAPAVHRNTHVRRAAVAAVPFFSPRSQTPRFQCQTSRPFSISHYRAQDAPSQSSEKKPDFPSSSPSSKSSVDDNIASILNNALDQRKGTPTAPASRTSRFSSPRAQARNQSSGGQADGVGSARRPSGGSSVDDLLASMEKGFRGPRRQGSSPSSSSFMDIESMIDPKGTLRDLPPAATVERPRIKLGPTVGRTVSLEGNRGMDIGRAFRSLEMLCARNSVRRDAMRQRFHERPGLRRKRLKSERWRKNFKLGFKAVVSKVQKMKRQGW